MGNDYLSTISELGQTTKNFVKSVNRLAFSWNVAMSRNPEIRKRMMICRRTKKKRIKKKQLIKVKKLFQGENV